MTEPTKEAIELACLARNYTGSTNPADLVYWLSTAEYTTIMNTAKEIDAFAAQRVAEAIDECARWLAPNFPGQARDMIRALKEPHR